MPDSDSRQVVLVTGATSGIGRAVAEQLGRAGARLFLCARTPTRSRRRSRNCATEDVEVDGAACDVGRPRTSAAFVRRPWSGTARSTSW